MENRRLIRTFFPCLRGAKIFGEWTLNEDDHGGWSSSISKELDSFELFDGGNLSGIEVLWLVKEESLSLLVLSNSQHLNFEGKGIYVIVFVINTLRFFMRLWKEEESLFYPIWLWIFKFKKQILHNSDNK